ncbi:MAG TPA: RNA methyltransferase [Pseudobdellovibrionaceae bacterium]|nr:RNA methyltransferase [Pseudobdellovibrionaceae bacterium]
MALDSDTPYKIDLRIVLVRSLYDRNIGATSRAMTNMGISRLILIAPQCELTYSAQQAAARGQSPLQKALIYKDWDEFFQSEPESLRISFTARDGRMRNVLDLEPVFSKIIKSQHFKKSQKNPLIIHFIFGPEDCGLSEEDLSLTHFSTCIPTYGENLSLNLSQATLLGMYSFRQFLNSKKNKRTFQFLDYNQIPTKIISPKSKSKDLKVSQSQKPFPEDTLKDWISELGFDLSQRRMNALTVLKRILLHSLPTDKELRVLEAVLQQNIRKLKEWKTLKNLK